MKKIVILAAAMFASASVFAMDKSPQVVNKEAEIENLRQFKRLKQSSSLGMALWHEHEADQILTASVIVPGDCGVGHYKQDPISRKWMSVGRYEDGYRVESEIKDETAIKFLDLVHEYLSNSGLIEVYYAETELGVKAAMFYSNKKELPSELLALGYTFLTGK
jgi:hypothetical protein